MQDHATDELHVVVPHVEHAPAGFADGGKRFGDQAVEWLAIVEALVNSAVIPASCASDFSSRCLRAGLCEPPAAGDGGLRVRGLYQTAS